MTHLIVGTHQRAREAALLKRLEPVFDDETRRLDALFIVPTRRRAESVRRAVRAHFDGRCWTSRVETLDSLVRRHAFDLDETPLRIEDDARAMLIQELLPDSGLLRRGRVTRGFARKIVEVLNAIGAGWVEDGAPLDAITGELVSHAPTYQRAFATLAAKYDDALRRRSLVDDRTLTLRLVRQWRESGYPEPAAALVIDEFARLRPIDRHLLTALSKPFSQTIVTVSAPSADAKVVADDRRYAVTVSALNWATSREPSVEVVDGDLPSRPAARAATRLFANDDAAPLTGTDDASLRLNELPNRREEARFVARAIRQRLGDVPPDQADFQRFTVVVPSFSTYHGLIGELFPQYGLPTNYGRGIPIASSPAARRLHKVVTSILDDDFWSIDALSDVLSHARKMPEPDDLHERLNDLMGESFGSTESTERFSMPRLDRLVREAGIGGKFDVRAWYRRLETFLVYRHGMNPDTDDFAFDERFQSTATQTARDICALDAFHTRVGSLRRLSDIEAFRDGLLALSRDYGLEGQTFPARNADPDEEREYAAWQTVRDLLDETVDTFRALGGRYTARDFADYLAQALIDPSRQCYPPQPENAVAIVAFEQTAGQSFEDLFVIGLVEGEMPTLRSANFLIAPDPSKPLSDALIELDSLPLERFRFREMLMNAERVVLTHPTMERGRNLVPSPFVEDVRALFADASVLSDASDHPETHYAAYEVLSAMGARENSDGAERLGLNSQNVTRQLSVERARRDTQRWSEFDGYLDSERVGAILDAYTRRPFSVTQLATYAACPSRYFYERLLNLRSVETLDPDIAPNLRGEIAHDILDRYFREFGSRQSDMPETGAAREQMNRIAVETLRQRDAQFPNLYWEEEKRALLSGLISEAEPKGLLRAFLDAEYGDHKTELEGAFVRGAMTEVVFQNENARRPTTGARIDPYTLAREDGSGEINVIGRIDRVDLDKETGRFVVYDYKFGSYMPSVTDALEGRNFQLALYLDALEGHQGCEEGVAAAFYRVPNPKEIKRDGFLAQKESVKQTNAKNGIFERERFEELRAFVRRNVQEIERHTRAGHFHLTRLTPIKAGCSFCDYSSICRLDLSREQAIRPTQPHYAPTRFGQPDDTEDAE
ncbi:MAG: PD-(D/E)XK nuclease family protein [Candidatus Poribacteria bacterium]|nr:PD-(D/E)XK nuclease family protein [Candidatus Poribacteria bacterium]